MEKKSTKGKMKGFRYSWLYIRIMLVEALVLAGYYRFKILKVPFAKIAPTIGEDRVETPNEPVDEATRQFCNEVSWCVDRTCTHTPWESKCLVRALTAKTILYRRGYQSTLYMGVALDEKGEMVAHAWLRCGDRSVTGGIDTSRYAVTNIYGAKR